MALKEKLNAPRSDSSNAKMIEKVEGRADEGMAWGYCRIGHPSFWEPQRNEPSEHRPDDQRRLRHTLVAEDSWRSHHRDRLGGLRRRPIRRLDRHAERCSALRRNECSFRNGIDCNLCRGACLPCHSLFVGRVGHIDVTSASIEESNAPEGWTRRICGELGYSRLAIALRRSHVLIELPITKGS